MSLPRLTGQVLAFSRFWLTREAGLLIADGAVINLAARPLAVLAALLDAGGRVVSADELRNVVWHGAHVDANTVQAQISAIRRALDEERDLIVTVPGRGYRFSGKIRLVELPGAQAPAGFTGATTADNGVPAPSSSLEGHVGINREAHRPAARRSMRLAATRSATRHGAAPVIPPDPHGAHGAREQALHTPSAFGPGGVEAVLGAQSGAPLTPFTGRHAELSELLAVVPARRAVTLTGASGIGKTRLAAEAASRLGSHFPDGVFWVDLASLSQPERIANTIGAALGLAPVPDYSAPAALAARIGKRRMLIVIDHCDGLRESAELAIESLLDGTPGLHVLVTAQMPLFIAGELPVAIAPLRTPAAAVETPSAGTGAGQDAPQLLLARLTQRLTQEPNSTGGEPRVPCAAASLQALESLRTAATQPSSNSSTSQALVSAARVCRRVGGLPLALELAAAAIAARTQRGAPMDGGAQPALYGVLAACAGELDALVTRRAGASRIALPHAEIVRAVLEWSCAALDDVARAALRRLAVFAGTFSRAAALDVLGAFATRTKEGASGASAAIERALETLSGPGFVNAIENANDGTCDNTNARLRLAPALRRFALEALDRRHESDEAANHHAHYYARVLARCASVPARARKKAGSGACSLGPDIDNLRAALEWALAADKVELCVELLDHAAPIWPALGLADEYVHWIRAALARAQAAPIRRIRDEMRLHAALARALPSTRAAAVEIAANWTRAYALATECADTPYRLCALFRLVLSALDAGDVARATPLVSEFGDIAAIAQSFAARVNARCLEGLVRAWHGEFEEAIRLLAPLVERPARENDAIVEGIDPEVDDETLQEADAMATGFGLSLHLVASAVLAVARWFVGVPLPGTAYVPEDEGDPVGGSVALALACAIAVLDGNAAQAQTFAASLVACARQGALRRWLRAGLDVQLWLDAREGDLDAAHRLLEGAARRLGRDQVYLLDIAFIATLLPRTRLGDDPMLAATLGAAVRTALQRAERVGDLWHALELQRIEAALRLATGEPAQVVRARLEAALACAQRCNAQRIALRITVDLETLDVPHGDEDIRVR